MVEKYRSKAGGCSEDEACPFKMDVRPKQTPLNLPLLFLSQNLTDLDDFCGYKEPRYRAIDIPKII
jgi:hypothetical protein